MNKYPKVNYIGNKEKIAIWIVDNFPLSEGVVLDLFSGGSSISYKLKQKGYEVISNDVLYSNFVLSKAIIENSTKKLKLNLTEKQLDDYFDEKIFKDISWLINKLYFEEEVIELTKLLNFSNTLSQEEKYIFLSLLRRAMIRKLPYSRMNIKWEEIIKLRDEEYSYQKYKRRRSYHNKTFLFHIFDNLENYNNSIFSNNKNNKSYQEDASELLKKIEKKIDIIYIDPPYPSTMNKYGEFYGDFDRIFNKSKTYTDYTDKKNFLTYIHALIKEASEKANYVLISLNNKSKPNYLDIENEIKSNVKSIKILERKHNYKVTGKVNKNETIEILMIIEM